MTFCGFDKRKVVPFIIAQIAGAFASAALVYALYSNLFTQGELTHNVVRGSVESPRHRRHLLHLPQCPALPTCRLSRSRW